MAVIALSLSLSPLHTCALFFIERTLEEAFDEELERDSEIEG